MFVCLSCHTQEYVSDADALHVPRVAQADVEAAEVPALLDQSGVAWQEIATVNWPAYPYRPQAQFRLAHTGSAILVHYRVDEECVAAVEVDGGAIFRDACCEFFLAPTDDGIYYNFETNCAGYLLLEAGTGRGNLRSAAPTEVLAMVQRWASLGRDTFTLRRQPTHWELALVIPVEALYRHTVGSLSGRVMRGNFYKYGSALCQRHYLSWRPILTPNPDFHQPAYFGTLVFDQ